MVILEEKISPDKKHKIVSFQMDLGAFDYSRVYWVIIPTNSDKSVPLDDYIIPDGYKAVDWNSKDEVIVEKWSPYYYRDVEVELRTGDKLNGVIVEIKQ